MSSALSLLESKTFEVRTKGAIFSFGLDFEDLESFESEKLKYDDLIGDGEEGGELTDVLEELELELLDELELELRLEGRDLDNVSFVVVLLAVADEEKEANINVGGLSFSLLPLDVFRFFFSPSVACDKELEKRLFTLVELLAGVKLGNFCFFLTGRPPSD